MALDHDQRLPGALTRDEATTDPNQASSAALDGNYGKVVKTARIAGKTNAEALQAINQSPVAISTHPFDTRRGEQVIPQASK